MLYNISRIPASSQVPAIVGHEVALQLTIENVHNLKVGAISITVSEALSHPAAITDVQLLGLEGRDSAGHARSYHLPSPVACLSLTCRSL